MRCLFVKCCCRRLTMDAPHPLVPYHSLLTNSSCLAFIPLHNLIVFPKEIANAIDLYSAIKKQNIERLRPPRSLSLSLSHSAAVRGTRLPPVHRASLTTPKATLSDSWREAGEAGWPAVTPGAGRLWPGGQADRVPSVYRSRTGEAGVGIWCCFSY